MPTQFNLITPRLPQVADDGGEPEGKWILILLLVFVFGICAALSGCSSLKKTTTTEQVAQIQEESHQMTSSIRMDSIIRQLALACDTLDYWFEVLLPQADAIPRLQLFPMVDSIPADSSPSVDVTCKPLPVARSHLRAVGLKANAGETKVEKQVDSVRVDTARSEVKAETKVVEKDKKSTIVWPFVIGAVIVVIVLIAVSLLKRKFL